jgi:hypothetical protein
VGFVYLITNLKNGRIYVGKKILKNTNKVKIGVKERLALPVVKGRKPVKKTVIKESNWADYYGSSELLTKDIELLGKESFKREILKICYSKKELSFQEAKYQFIYEVLEHNSYNRTILGKYYSSDVSKSSEKKLGGPQNLC